MIFLTYNLITCYRYEIPCNIMNIINFLTKLPRHEMEFLNQDITAK